MIEFDVLADECNPNPACPKVIRPSLGELVVVGTSGVDTGTVDIAASLYARALEALMPGSGRNVGAGMVSVTGQPITEPELLRAYGVGPGEAAVVTTEEAFAPVDALLGAKG